MFKIISPVLSLVLAATIFFFFAKPIFAEIEQIQNETNEYREAVEKATEFNNFLQSLITKRNSFSSLELERLEALIPQEINEVRALVDLKALAEQHRMLFGNIKVSKSESGGSNDDDEGPDRAITRADFETAEVSFGVIGTYEQMRSFLQDVERSLTLMETTALDFQVSEGDLLLFDVTVRLYSYQPTVVE